MAFSTVLGGLEPGEAGRAGDGEIAFDRVGQAEVLGAQGERQQLIDVVGRGGPAAEPVRYFLQPYAQGLEQAPRRFVVFFGRGVQGAAGIVGIGQYIFHGKPLFLKL